MPSLSAASFIILGMLDRYGPSTPYGVDGRIRKSIGYFWWFPRSQLYTEATRLARRGLVDMSQEPDGRRRKLLSITPAGAHALSTWLREASSEPNELRDGGLLRLFFIEHSADPGSAVLQLAEQEERSHRDRLAWYAGLVGNEAIPENSPQRAALEVGIRYERMLSDFWAQLRTDPPTVFADRPGATAGSRG